MIKRGIIKNLGNYSASECPENNQSALFKLGNFLVLNSYI